MDSRKAPTKAPAAAELTWAELLARLRAAAGPGHDEGDCDPDHGFSSLCSSCRTALHTQVVKVIAPGVPAPIPQWTANPIPGWGLANTLLVLLRGLAVSGQLRPQRAASAAMRFEYSFSEGSCSLTHNLTTGKAEHLGACDDAGPPPLPCCGGLRGQHAQTLCQDKAIPHLFVVSTEPDDLDPGMVDVRAYAFYLGHQGAEGTLQALSLPAGAIPRLGWYQLRTVGTPGGEGQ